MVTSAVVDGVILHYGLTERRQANRSTALGRTTRLAVCCGVFNPFFLSGCWYVLMFLCVVEVSMAAQRTSVHRHIGCLHLVVSLLHMGHLMILRLLRVLPVVSCIRLFEATHSAHFLNF